VLRWNKFHHDFSASYTINIKLASPELFRPFYYKEHHFKLRKIILELKEKKFSFKEISSYLNKNGFKTKSGKQFTPSLIKMFLNKINKRVSGYLELEIISVKVKKLKIDRNKIKDYLLY